MELDLLTLIRDRVSAIRSVYELPGSLTIGSLDIKTARSVFSDSNFRFALESGLKSDIAPCRVWGQQATSFNVRVRQQCRWNHEP